MIAELRSRVVGAVGPRAVHALEDGATVGVVLGMAWTAPTLAAAILALLGATPARAGPMAIISEVYDLVRQDDARAQESYFVLSIMAGALVGAPVGSAVAPFIGSVPLPT